MKEDSLPILIGAFAGDSPSDLIEEQEARGQKNLCVSDVLPTKIKYSDKQMLISWGFEFAGDPIKDDYIFTECKFPKGWEKVATGHSMWSDLVDEKGRKRGSIFYKAAFYDRSAHMGLSRRFRIIQDYDVQKNKSLIIYQVFDGDNLVYTSDEYEYPSAYGKGLRELDKDAKEKVLEKYNKAEESSNNECLDWLKDNYPDWENVGAYWD